MPKKAGRTPGPKWTPMMRAFVEGLKKGLNQTEAARQANYKQPDVRAVWLMRNPLVIAAMEEHRAVERKAEEKVADKQATKIAVSKSWVIERLGQLAGMTPGETNNNITGQVRAALGLAEVLGMKIGARDPDKFEGFTDEELKQYLHDGTVPERYASRFGIASGGPSQVM